MTPEERQLLTAMADRIKGAPRQDHDAEADQLLGQLLRERPDTPYLLAQTVLMQDLSMRNAQAQIADLQQQLSQQSQAPAQRSSGGFLSGLFGGGSAPSAPPPNPWGQPYPGQAYAAPPGGGYAPVVMQPAQTSGFLRSAATTAAGIAGGALLFEGIESLFAGHQGYGGFMNPGGWGGMGGGGEFMPRESLSETTINNYYGDSPEASGQQNSDFSTDQSFGQGNDDRGGFLNTNDPIGNLDPGTDNGGDFSSSDGDFGGDSGDFST